MHVGGGAFGKFVAWNAMIKCYQAINVWKQEFNGYLMVCFLSKEDLVCTCSAYSKLIGFYTLVDIISKKFSWENIGTIGALFVIMI